MRQCKLVPLLLYGSETMVWREKEKSRIKDMQTDKLKGLFDIRRKDTAKCICKSNVE